MPKSVQQKSSHLDSFNGLLSGVLLTKNVIWSLFGRFTPLLVALFIIPFLIQEMGTERFGLLSIIWMGVGYFSLFDLGIGRALTKLVAERLGTERQADLPQLIRTGMHLMVCFGLFAALAVGLITPWLVGSVFKIPPVLHLEAIWSFWIMAATIPFVIASAGFTGILQAWQQFARINLVRIPLGISNFIGPLFVVLYTPSLVAVTLVIACSRIVAWLLFRHFCNSLYGGPKQEARIDRNAARALLSFGGWITISNFVGPLMVYFDRFFIAAALGLSAVAYYTTPYEVITQFWILPDALMNVLFPAFATSLVLNRQRTLELYHTAVRVILVAMFAPVALVILFAHEGLAFWINEEFARQSAGVLRWLALGVFINCFARLPLIALQSYGRPDLTAKLHLVELPIYIVSLWFLLRQYGLTGAAMSWTLRIVVDTVFLFFLNMKVIPALRGVSIQALSMTAVAALALFASFKAQDLILRIILGVSYFLMVLFIGWFSYQNIKKAECSAT